MTAPRETPPDTTRPAGSPPALSVRESRQVRYGGFAGAVLLSLSTFLGGAMPHLERDTTPLTIARGPNGPLILSAWLIGAGLLVAAWWRARDREPSTRWVYVTILLWSLPLLVAPPFGSRDVYAYACQGAVYAAGHDPYGMGVADLPCPWVASVSRIWRHTPAPYGALFVLLAGAAVRLGGSLAGAIALFRVIAVCGVGLTAWCLPKLAARCGVPERKALWLALACPLVAGHLVAGAHNDALMIGLLVAGLAVVSTRPGHPATLLAGGAVLGLAAGVKATAAVVLPFAALVAVSSGYRKRDLARDAGWVFGGAGASVAAVTLGTGLGVGWLGGLAHSGDSVQWTSPPTSVGLTAQYVVRLFGAPANMVPITTARAVALAVLVVIVVALWRWAWRTARDAGGPATAVNGLGGPAAALYGAGLALAATVALSPVFHPWYLTWPLAVLAATTNRTRWLALAAALASFLVLADGTAFARATKVPGALAMTALIGYVLVRWLRRVPRHL